MPTCSFTLSSVTVIFIFSVSTHGAVSVSRSSELSSVVSSCFTWFDAIPNSSLYGDCPVILCFPSLYVC